MTMDMDPQEEHLWPFLRDNAVQIVVYKDPIISGFYDAFAGSGTVIYSNKGKFFILTCGHTIEDIFTDASLDVYVRFHDKDENRKFEGVSDTMYKAKVITDVDDAEIEVAILYVEAPPKELPGAFFREDPVEDGMKMMMCSNMGSFNRFAHVPGHVCSRYVPGYMANDPQLSWLVDHTLLTGKGSSGAGMYDMSGCLFGVHIQVMFIDCDNGSGGYYKGVNQGISIDTVIPVIESLCTCYKVSIASDPYKMLDNLCKVISPDPAL